MKSEINIAPSWAYCATIYMAVLQNPDASYEGIQSAKEELLRMAAIADRAVAASKEDKS
jgi:hypothetical protein